MLVAVGAQLHGALEVRRDGAAPAGPDAADPVDRELLARPDRDGAGDRLDVEHEPRLAVGRGPADLQPLALADGEAVRALVAAQHLAGGVVDDVAAVVGRGGAELLLEPAGVVAVGDEADVVGVRLVGDQQPAAPGLEPDVGLGGVAEREQRVRELLLGEHAEHVGLVLAHVDGPVHLDQPVVTGPQLGVVAGGHRVEAQVQRAVEHRRELDLLVAAQAGVRRPAGGVLGHEVLDHVLVEAVAQVPDVEGDPDDVGGPAGVVAVLDRAAAARPAAVGLRVAREREVDAGDVVAGLGGAGGSDGRVHPAGHGGEDLHQPSLRCPALRARSTTGPMAASTASTSAAVLVCPSENRSEPRASASV